MHTAAHQKGEGAVEHCIFLPHTGLSTIRELRLIGPGAAVGLRGSDRVKTF